MSISVSQLHPALHDLFHGAADRLAEDTGFCRRRRQLGGGAFAKAVVFGLLERPAPSLQDFADFASDHLGVGVSHNAFEQRFGPRAAGLLASLLAAALKRCFSARPALLPVLRRFNGVYLRDASTVGLPGHLAGQFPGRKGKGGRPSAALRLVLEMELSTGLFTAAEVLPALGNEKASEAAGRPLPEGSLLLEDMGFLSGERLQGHAERGVYFLARVPAWTAFFERKRRGRGYERLDVVRWLRRARGRAVERRVSVFHKQKLELRLLAVRVPEEVAEQRRERARREARGRGRPVSRKRLELCAWNVLVTNAPRQLLRASEGWEVRRARWQIELVFRVFKSEGGLERTQARSRDRVLAELYAKLLAMVVLRRALLAAGFRPLLHGGQPAARRAKKRAGPLARALGSRRRLGRELKELARRLRACRVQKRHRRASTLDRLSALDPELRQLDLAA